MSATAAVKSRLDRFNSGEWRELWADAQGHTNLEWLQKPHQGFQSVEAAERSRLARAKHFALNMQLRDARHPDLPLVAVVCRARHTGQDACFVW